MHVFVFVLIVLMTGNRQETRMKRNNTINGHTDTRIPPLQTLYATHPLQTI
jgi:hypothetical protein